MRQVSGVILVFAIIGLVLLFAGSWGAFEIAKATPEFGASVAMLIIGGVLLLSSIFCAMITEEESP